MMKKVIQKGLKIVRLSVLCMFTFLFCIVFVVAGMVYSLADCAVRKLEKGGGL